MRFDPRGVYNRTPRSADSMRHQQPASNVLSDSLFISAGDLLNRAKGLLFVPIIVGIAGADNYAILVLLLANIAIVKSLASLGAGGGFQRFASSLTDDSLDELASHLYSILWATILVSSLIAGLYALSAPLFSSTFFGDNDYGPTLLHLSALVIISNAVYSNMSKFLLCRKRFKVYSVASLVYGLVPYGSFVVTLAWTGSFLVGFFAYVCADLLIAGGLTFWICRPYPVQKPKLEVARQYFSYSSPLALSEIESALMTKVDKYAIAFFIDLETLAVYNVLVSIFLLFDGLNAPIRKQVMSYLPKPWDSGFQTDATILVRELLLLYCGIVIPLIWCVSVYSENFVSGMLLNSVVVEGLIVPATMLGLAALLANTRRFYNQIIKLRKRSFHVLSFQLVGLVPCVALNFLLVPRFGIAGAAFSSLISYVAIVLVMGRSYSLSINASFWIALIKFAALGSVVWLVFVLFSPETIFASILCGGMSLLLYAGLVFLLMRSERSLLEESFLKFREFY